MDFFRLCGVFSVIGFLSLIETTPSITHALEDVHHDVSDRFALCSLLGGKCIDLITSECPSENSVDTYGRIKRKSFDCNNTQLCCFNNTESHSYGSHSTQVNGNFFEHNHLLRTEEGRTQLCGLINGTCVGPNDCAALQGIHGYKLRHNTFDCNLTSLCCFPSLHEHSFHGDFGDGYRGIQRHGAYGRRRVGRYGYGLSGRRGGVLTGKHGRGYGRGFGGGYEPIGYNRRRGYGKPKGPRYKRVRRKYIIDHSAQDHSGFGGLGISHAHYSYGNNLYVANFTAHCLANSGLCIPPNECATGSRYGPHRYACNHTAICCLPISHGSRKGHVSGKNPYGVNFDLVTDRFALCEEKQGTCEVPDLCNHGHYDFYNHAHSKHDTFYCNLTMVCCLPEKFEVQRQTYLAPRKRKKYRHH